MVIFQSKKWWKGWPSKVWRFSVPKEHIYISISVNTVFENEILGRLRCVLARYNGENTPDKCMEGTCVGIMKNIVTRLTAVPEASQRVVMLSGSAGSGKSTLAKSVAAVLAEQQKILAASFFFSRDYTERKELRYVPSTLARQLADYNADFRQLLVEYLDGDCTGILSAETHLQFQKLIIELLTQVPSSAEPWVICLDALDEWGPDHGQTFLRLLSDNITKIPVHIRFFLTGRPDVPLYLEFDALHFVMHPIILDDMDSPTVNQDIHLYVRQSLDGSNWTTRSIWKAEVHDVDEITSRAAGLFIFAATAVRYVLVGSSKVSPQKAIDHLLRGGHLIRLHDLYKHIIDEAIPRPTTGDLLAQNSYNSARQVLGAICQVFEPRLQHPGLITRHRGGGPADNIAASQLHHPCS
jgi:energy-coupling factor transporter ATP-binding protein EcfA2